MPALKGTIDERVRSYLAAPAHQGRMIARAAASAADALFLDLEDAVPASEKTVALESAVTLLKELDFGEKHVAVRINTRESGLAGGEVQALKECKRLNAVILPKAEKEEDIRFVQDVIGRLHVAKSPTISIELLVETAAGLMRVDSLAAHPAVTALHLGVGDLAASLGARSAEVGAFASGLPACHSRERWPCHSPARPLRLPDDARACGCQSLRASRDRRPLRSIQGCGPDSSECSKGGCNGL